MDIRWMSDDVADGARGGLPLRRAVAGRYRYEVLLGTDTHHLAIAYVDDAPAGFVSGVEITHPDKATEMFLYELGVDDAFHGRGIGHALVEALRDLAREQAVAACGC